MERLCGSIAGFDRSWMAECVPAADGQIRQLENICGQFGYQVPKVYSDYLRTMGENDGGLLEREWDGYMEPSIHTILKLFSDESFDAKESLQQGLLLFSYHWTEAHCYLRISQSEDNPVVVNWENRRFAGSFEKYLFQKAFCTYQETFRHRSFVGTSILSCDAVLKKHSFACSVRGGTAEEKMAFVRWLAKSLALHEEETWFGDDLNFFSYNEHYALRVHVYYSLQLVFSCDTIAQKKQVDSILNRVFPP